MVARDITQTQANEIAAYILSLKFFLLSSSHFSHTFHSYTTPLHFNTPTLTSTQTSQQSAAQHQGHTNYTSATCAASHKYHSSNHTPAVSTTVRITPSRQTKPTTCITANALTYHTNIHTTYLLPILPYTHRTQLTQKLHHQTSPTTQSPNCSHYHISSLPITLNTYTFCTHPNSNNSPPLTPIKPTSLINSPPTHSTTQPTNYTHTYPQTTTPRIQLRSPSPNTPPHTSTQHHKSTQTTTPPHHNPTISRLPDSCRT